MKQIFRIFRGLSMMLLLPVIAFTQNGDIAKKLAGTWTGPLKVQGIELRLVLNIRINEADSLIVTMDSPDQGAKDIQTSKVIIRNDSLLVSVKKIGGRFSGKIDAEYTFLDGKWSQGGMAFPLKLERQEKPMASNRQQEPKQPLPYRVVEVKFTNSAAGIELAGTLTIPEKEGKYPAVILVSGSGPQNRDEELMGHKPFYILSDYLTRMGVAVLRFDDRGVAHSGGSFKTATTLDFATDAAAALDFLKKYPEIDSAGIGILGHSEGGLIAPIVASTHPEVAFVILLAGPGVTGEKILMTQSKSLALTEGNGGASIEKAQKLNKDIYTVLKKNSENDRAATKIRALFAAYDRQNAGDTSYHKMSEAEISGQIDMVTSPWFRCFLTLDPEVYLRKVKCPLLAINGSLDLQVDSKINLEAIEKALIFGGNSKYSVQELPGLNHLFQTAKTGSPYEYGKIEETMSPVALEAIGSWVKEIAK